jgi:MFS family permease
MRNTVATGKPSVRWPEYLAPWYLAYLILGVINSGMLPFLLPLAVAAGGYDLDSIAYVIGAYNIGLLPAPLFGVLAERNRLFRPVFFGGFLALSCGLGLIAHASQLGGWIVLAGLCGLGVGAVATVAPLFVVDFAPKAEWNPRIGWLQGFNGAGQLAGLLLAGLIARGPLADGFWLAAVLSAVALVVGRIGLPADGGRPRTRLPPVAWGRLMSGFQSGPPMGGLLQYSHHLQAAVLRRLRRPLGGEFSRFVLAWAALNFGVAPFFAYYPLMMKKSYGIVPTTTALLYALSAAVGVGLFVLAGHVTQRRGPRFVFRVGLALRTAGFGVLAVLIFALPAAMPAIAMSGFALVMLAWPVLSVSGTGLAASLTPIGEGAAMGMLAASNAMATVIGTFLAGPLVAALGYRIVPPIAIAGLLSAAALMRQGARERGEAGDGGNSVNVGRPRSSAALQPPRSSERCGSRPEPGSEKR